MLQTPGSEFLKCPRRCTLPIPKRIGCFNPRFQILNFNLIHLEGGKDKESEIIFCCSKKYIDWYKYIDSNETVPNRELQGNKFGNKNLYTIKSSKLK